MNRLLPSVAAGLCLLTGISVCVAEDWNQWRGSNRDGAAADSPPLLSELPADGLKPVWISEPVKSARGGGWSSPVVAGGKVYVYTHTREDLRNPGPRKFPWLSEDKRVGMTAEDYAAYEIKRREEEQQRAQASKFGETIFCFDAATGETLWKDTIDSVYSRFPQSGTPAVIDGRLYVLGAGRQARCLDAETGREIWKTRLPGEFRDEFMQSSFAIVDGAAVVLASYLFGLDAGTGKILWQGDEKLTSGTHTSPVAWRSKLNDRPLVVVNVADDQTACFDPRTGSELWRVDSEARHSTPVVVGDLLLTFGNSRKKGLRCFRMTPSGAELQWTFHGAADKGSSPVVVDGYVYVQGEKRLACVELATGDAEWSATLDVARPQYTSLFAADEKIFYACGGFLCVAATPARFTPLLDAKFNAERVMAGDDYFRQQLKLDELEREPDGLEKSQKLYDQQVGRQGPLDCATPAIANGRVFIRFKDAVACYDLRHSRVRTATAE